MAVSLGQFFAVYRMPVGRRLFTHRGMLQLLRQARPGNAAEKLQTAAFIAHLEQAIADDERARERQLALSSSGAVDPVTAEAQREADAQFDRMVSALSRALDARIAISDHPEPLLSLRDRLFPDGVSGITAIPYAEELEEARRLDSVLEDAGEVASFLAPFRPKVAEAAVVLEAVLSESQGAQLPTQKDLELDDDRGHLALLSTLARALGRHPGLTLEDETGRDTILDRFLTQQAELGASLRRHGGGSGADVDPDTGTPASLVA